MKVSENLVDTSTSTYICTCIVSRPMSSCIANNNNSWWMEEQTTKTESEQKKKHQTTKFATVKTK